MVYVSMLTSEHRKRLIDLASQKYGVQLSSEQIVQLVPARMTCESVVYMPSQMVRSAGGAFQAKQEQKIESKKGSKGKKNSAQAKSGGRVRAAGARQRRADEELDEIMVTFAGRVMDFQKFPLRIEFVLPDTGADASRYQSIIESLNTVRLAIIYFVFLCFAFNSFINS